MNIIEKARIVAIALHWNQKYGSEPYLTHLLHIVEIVKRYSEVSELIAAAWLHDTIEDTKIDVHFIEQLINPRVAEIVFAVTDEQGKTRKERHQKTYLKIRKDRDAVFLKLADRIANTEYSVSNKSSMFNMYKKEYPDFKQGIMPENPDQTILRMFSYLESLYDTRI